MSLLIKALQKAERNKTAVVSGEEVAVQGETAGPPLTLPPDVLDDDIHSLAEETGFEDVASAPKPAIKSGSGVPQYVASTQKNSPQAAANVFKAKEEHAAGGSSNRALRIALSGGTILLLVGGVFYYYLESIQQPMIVVPPRPSLQLPVPVAGGVTEDQSATRPTTMPASMEPSSSADALPPPVSTATEAQVVAPISTPASEPVVAVEKAPEKISEPALAVPPPAKVKKPARKESGVSKSLPRNHTMVKTSNNSVAMSAYQAFMAGDDEAAERLYLNALQSEPKNTDILLGLAAIAARHDKVEEVERHYMHVLELEPRNVAAQAGLIGLMGRADPVRSESRLKSLLAQQPEAAFLHEALGDLYAEQTQWPSAQQAYFQAFHFEPSSAEYAFNLAVSLDQLGKAELALNYYQRAQELHPRKGGTLDIGQLEKRINQLRQLLNK